MLKHIENRPQLSTSTKQIVLMQNEAAVGTAHRTFVVVGLERGGTSMVAGVCRALGIDFGDRTGLNHEDPCFLSDNFEVLKKRVKARNLEARVWGFKAPKASLQLDFYEKTLRNPHYIFVYRNTLSVADSWIQRGAGRMQDILERTVHYHATQAEFARKTKNPILYINYERAVANKANQHEFVLALSKFLGAGSDEESLAKGADMITGDGKGYINLPDEYFYVETVQNIPERQSFSVTEIKNTEILPSGFLDYKKVNPGQIFTFDDGGFVPKRFFLRINIESKNLKNYHENPIRIFFNFNGKRHPGHCARPEIQAGKNEYFIETSGNARDISFGVINPPKSIKLEIEAFEATDQDRANSNAMLAATPIAQNSI